MFRLQRCRLLPVLLLLVAGGCPTPAPAPPLPGAAVPGFFDGTWQIVLRTIPDSPDPGFEPSNDRHRFVSLTIEGGYIRTFTNALSETFEVTHSTQVAIGPGGAFSTVNDSAGWTFSFPEESGIEGAGSGDGDFLLQLKLNADVATENELPGLIDFLPSDHRFPPKYGFSWFITLRRAVPPADAS